jgi:hypothetical protein
MKTEMIIWGKKVFETKLGAWIRKQDFKLYWKKASPFILQLVIPVLVMLALRLDFSSILVEIILRCFQLVVDRYRK